MHKPSAEAKLALSSNVVRVVRSIHAVLLITYDRNFFIYRIHR